MPLKDLAEVKSKICSMKIIPKVWGGGGEDLSEIWKIAWKTNKISTNYRPLVSN